MEKNNQQKSDKILVIAAHPDDEVLGIGGTAAKLVEEGNEVFCMILSRGVISRDEDNAKNKMEELKKESEKAAGIIGFKKIFFEDLPDNKFDSVPLLDVVKKIENYLFRLNPRIVFTHHETDLNVDHQLTFKAVLTACRPCNPECPQKLYSFEILSSTEWQSKTSANIFLPTTYINIAGTLHKKLKAIEAYHSEIRNYPHPRSVEGIKILAKFRGMESGMELAEAVRLIKNIKK